MDAKDTLLNYLSANMRNENDSKIKEWFDNMANLLMNKIQIQKGEAIYEIVECEFYYYSPNHPDVITYKRNLDVGMWFFHNSGVDLTFRTLKKDKHTNEFLDNGDKMDKDDCFGGILIRGLKKISTQEGEIFILGPLKLTNILWDVFYAFQNLNKYPLIINKISSDRDRSDTIYNSARWIKNLDNDEEMIKKIKTCSKNNLKNFELDNTIEKELTILRRPYRYIRKDAYDSKGWKKKYGMNLEILPIENI